MKPEEFTTLADAGYNRIPVMRKVLADLETPLSAYLKLAKGNYSYLFESVQGGEKWGRYSILGLPCHTVLKATGDQIIIEQRGKIIEQHQHDIAKKRGFQLTDHCLYLYGLCEDCQ